MELSCWPIAAAGRTPLADNAYTPTWTSTGSGKFDDNDEEGWVLLPGGKVLDG